MPADSQTTPLPAIASLPVVAASLARQWWPVALFSILWLDLIRQLSYQWSNREQYAYGWFVPVLALGLLWRRASIPPKPQPMAPPAWMFWLVTAVLLVLLPVRVIHEINQDWPLFTWPLALGGVALSLYAIFLLGGWPWVRHFIFPICFILAAISWPYRIEHGLTQSLMHAVSAVTVTVLGWVDILAFQHGNVIEISGGGVGIDEACSGIRSFQSMLMGALFLGELYRLRWPHRLILVGGGVLIAFGLNVVRTLVLTWRASDVGVDLVEKWHDPAGLSIFLASFACLWLLAWRLRKREVWRLEASVQSPKSKAQSLEAGAPSAKRGVQTLYFKLWALDSEPRPAPLSPQPSVSRLWTLGFGLWTRRFASARLFLTTVGCWSLCILGLNEFWYRTHEIKDAGVYHWTMRFPESLASFTRIELPQNITQMLGYNSGATGRWREPDGSDWSAYFFRWDTGSAQSLIRARLHRPEVCLPASGFRQLSPSRLVWIDAGRLKLPFRVSAYEIGGVRAYVLFGLWEDSTETQMALWASPEADRLRSVLVGRRRLGQQTCELVLSGYGSIEAAQEAVKRRLPDLVRLNGPLAAGS